MNEDLVVYLVFLRWLYVLGILYLDLCVSLDVPR